MLDGLDGKIERLTTLAAKILSTED